MQLAFCKGLALLNPSVAFTVAGLKTTSKQLPVTAVGHSRSVDKTLALKKKKTASSVTERCTSCSLVRVGVDRLGTPPMMAS